MRNTKGRPENPELVKCEGCKGCMKKCRENGPVAHPEVAARTKGMLFDCNSIKVILSV